MSTRKSSLKKFTVTGVINDDVPFFMRVEASSPKIAIRGALRALDERKLSYSLGPVLVGHPEVSSVVETTEIGVI